MSDVRYNQDELYRTRLVNIYTEANPNPNSMKFMLNFMLIKDGSTHDFPDAASAFQSPLAVALFGFNYVKRVFIMNNFVTVTKDEAADWNEVLPELKQYIKSYFEAQKPAFLEQPQHAEASANTNDTETVLKIKDVLAEYIKPAVEMDGGAIQFSSFDETNGKLTVALQGSCSGCPSSRITLKSGIENLMKRMVPQVQEVVAEDM